MSIFKVPFDWRIFEKKILLQNYSHIKGRLRNSCILEYIKPKEWAIAWIELIKDGETRSILEIYHRIGKRSFTLSLGMGFEEGGFYTFSTTASIFC